MPDTIPLNINYNSGGYSMSPPNPNISKGGTARFNASNCSCTIHFTPATTPFGASVTVQQGTHHDVPVGSMDYSVQYSISAAQATTGLAAAATTDSLTRVLDSGGTIKVGSG